MSSVPGSTAERAATPRAVGEREVLRLDAVDDGRVGEGRGVAEQFVLGDVAQQPPHDLARARLRQFLGEQDRLRLRDRTDEVRDVLTQLLDEIVAGLDTAAQGDERPRSPDRCRVVAADDPASATAVMTTADSTSVVEML